MVLDSATRILRLLPAEGAHRVSIGLTRLLAPFLPEPQADDPSLHVAALGLFFSNPLGLAAGFDKDAQIPDAMLKLGFGFVECGTVTPRPQDGNPRPRLFRLREDRAVINRLGFNNKGMEWAARSLARRRRGIAGISIGANRDSADRIADYAQCFVRLAPLADYVAVNVSSPNTPGLRGLQNRGELQSLLDRLKEVRGEETKPILLKIAPDLDPAALDEIAGVVTDAGIEGVIVSNTTVDRPSLASPHGGEAGGLSGKPLFARSTQVLREMRKRLPAPVVLIGVGGISCGRDAYEKILAGATLVQIYTSLIYEGPGLVAQIKGDLVSRLARDGFKSVAEAVGAEAR
ncbi:MAG: quinone-dependent dihydroorotate dehydrogenase [Rhizomicrobium sp.]